MFLKKKKIALLHRSRSFRCERAQSCGKVRVADGGTVCGKKRNGAPLARLFIASINHRLLGNARMGDISRAICFRFHLVAERKYFQLAAELCWKGVEIRLDIEFGEIMVPKKIRITSI